jgi:hypothetical protein
VSPEKYSPTAGRGFFLASPAQLTTQSSQYIFYCTVRPFFRNRHLSLLFATKRKSEQKFIAASREVITKKKANAKESE